MVWFSQCTRCTFLTSLHSTCSIMFLCLCFCVCSSGWNSRCLCVFARFKKTQECCCVWQKITHTQLFSSTSHICGDDVVPFSFVLWPLSLPDVLCGSCSCCIESQWWGAISFWTLKVMIFAGLRCSSKLSVMCILMLFWIHMENIKVTNLEDCSADTWCSLSFLYCMFHHFPQDKGKIDHQATK